MTEEEKREWAENLREHDISGGHWESVRELLLFLRRNWDFPGTWADAKGIFGILEGG